MTENEDRKTKVKKRYSMTDNFRYTFYHLRKKQGNGALFVCAGDVALSVVLPFLEAALAGAVAAALVSGKASGRILLLILGYVGLLQAVRFGQSHVRLLRVKDVFLFRCNLMTDYFRKILLMDGQSLESSTGQKKRDAANRNIYSGNRSCTVWDDCGKKQPAFAGGPGSPDGSGSLLSASGGKAQLSDGGGGKQELEGSVLSPAGVHRPRKRKGYPALPDGSVVSEKTLRLC